MKRGGHPMIFQEETLECYNWDNIFIFRGDMQEYLKSIGLIHKPEWCIHDGQAKNLSLSENSGYNYNPIR
jgi:hypothetical protein